MSLKKMAYAILPSLLALTACSGGVPTKSEIQKLITDEGMYFADLKVKSLFADLAYRRAVTSRNAAECGFFYNLLNDPSSIKLNEQLIRKYVESEIVVEGTNCEESKDFKGVYSCGVSIKYNEDSSFYLNKFDILFIRDDNGNLNTLSSGVFQLENTQEHPQAKVPFPKNLFSSLISRDNAPSLTSQHVHIPPYDANVYDIYSDDNSVITNKKYLLKQLEEYNISRKK